MSRLEKKVQMKDQVHSLGNCFIIFNVSMKLVNILFFKFKSKSKDRRNLKKAQGRKELLLIHIQLHIYIISILQLDKLLLEQVQYKMGFAILQWSFQLKQVHVPLVSPQVCNKNWFFWHLHPILK